MQVFIKMQNLFPLNSFFLNYESVSSTLKKGGKKKKNRYKSFQERIKHNKVEH